MKFYELAPFELRITADTIVAALAAEDANGAASATAVAAKEPDADDAVRAPPGDRSGSRTGDHGMRESET